MGMFASTSAWSSRIYNRVNQGDDVNLKICLLYLAMGGAAVTVTGCSDTLSSIGLTA